MEPSPRRLSPSPNEAPPVMQASCTFRVSRIVAICVLLVATELAVSRSNGQTVGSALDIPAPAAPQQDATPLPPIDASHLAPAPQPVVPLQELDLNYSQPWAYTPAPSASPYVPTYNPSWPPPGGTSFFTSGTFIPCDPCNVPASWGSARGFYHLRR